MGGYSPWGCKESDMTEQLTLSTLSNTEDNFAGTMSKCSLKCFSPDWSTGKYSFLHLISHGRPEVKMCIYWVSWKQTWLGSFLNSPHCISGVQRAALPILAFCGTPNTESVKLQDSGWALKAASGEGNLRRDLGILWEVKCYSDAILQRPEKSIT